MKHAEIERLFNLASELLHEAPSQPPLGPAQLLHPPDYTQLELYGLYKQATDSESYSIQVEEDPIRRKRWEAWSWYTSLTPHEARLLYLATIFPFIHRWTNLPARTQDWYLSSLTPAEKTAIEVLLIEFGALVYDLEKIPEIMAKVNFTPRENAPEAGNESSEFSFENLSIPRPSGRPRGGSFSSGNCSFPSDDYSLPATIEPTFPRRQSYSTQSVASSIEFVPTVTFTSTTSPTRRGSRRISISSIPSVSSCQSLKTRTPFSVSSNLARRPSLNFDGQPPLLIRDETSSLLKSTSHRLGQGMTLVQQSLQRLEKLEEKVNCALHSKPPTPPPSPRCGPYTPKSPTIQPGNPSLTGWISQVCYTLLS